MATMRKEQRDIDSLNALGIIGEAGRLFGAHAKVLSLIQLTLSLPVAIAYYLVWQYLPFPSIDGDSLNRNHLSTGHHVPRHLFTRDSSIPSSTASLHGDSVAPLLLSAVWVILAATALDTVLRAALSLSECATLYAVGLHYSGRPPVSFLEALRASFPRRWALVALTNTYCYLFVSVVLSVETIGFVLLDFYGVTAVWLTLFGILLVVAEMCVNPIVEIPAVGCVLEENYGWAAVGKTLQLLKGRVQVAVVFQVLFLFVVRIHGVLEMAVLSRVEKGGYSNSPWSSLMLLLIGVVALLALTTFAWQLKWLCSGVQYVSFMAYHEESLADSEGSGYERLGDGSDHNNAAAAPVDGQQPDPNV